MHANDGCVDHLHRNIMIPGECAHNLGPNASSSPANETIVAGRVRAEVVRQVAPWRPRSQDPEDAVEDTRIIHSWHAARLVRQTKRLNKAKKADNDKSSDGKNKLGGKEYERELARLHGELVKLQLWVVAKGLKVVVLFEAATARARAGLSRRSPSGSAHASIALSRFPRQRSARNPRCTFSAICGICQPRAKS